MTAAPAFADQVSNNVDASVDSTVEVMPLNVGGPNGTTTLRVIPTSGDGKNGCNLTAATSLTVAVTSSSPAVATVSPSSVTFTACGDTRSLAVTPVSAGSTTVTLTQTSNNTGATFDLTTATFRVDVTAAVNHAPSVSVTGVTKPAYELGVDTLPTPGCSATDAEDGPHSPVPAITDNRDQHGLGTVDVQCSYTDTGGLTAASSVTYAVVDTSNPIITFESRIPAANADGWNKGPVTVTWSCSDAGSGPVEDTVSVTVSEDGADQSATATCTDQAGNTASDSHGGISIDTVAPTLSFERAPVANGNGWNHTDVDVTWTCSDDRSGVTNGGGSLTLTDEGADQSITRTCTDLAGNSATDSSGPVSIDKTPPAIHLTRSPDANEDGWNDGPVTVSWACSDGGSGVTDPGGSVTLSDNGEDQSVTRTCTDLAGNTASDTITGINIDTTAPTIHISRDPEANGDHWNNTAVTVTWTCDDELSGPADDGDSTTLSNEGADQSAGGTCTDLAGNTASDTITGINIDTTAPTIQIGRAPAANDAGWNNTDVTVSWTCTDGLSGATDPGGSVLLSDEAAGQSAIGACTDRAGNTSSDTVEHVDIDKTAPTIHIGRSPAANANGWNNTDVTVTWTCSDTLSQPTNGGGSTTLTGEGAGQSAGGTCTDNADNSASDSITGINVDKTKPTVSWIGALTDGATYYFGQTPGAPACSAADGLSGVVGTCAVSGYSSAVGPHTVTATAVDRAGNIQTLSRSYTVQAWTPSGFYQPVDMNGVWNVVKGGSTVPLKFEVFRGSAEITDVATLGASFTVQGATCPGASAPTDDIELTTTGNTTLRYDATSGQFIQNWQTPKNSGACYRVTMTAADGSALAAMFKLK